MIPVALNSKVMLVRITKTVTIPGNNPFTILTNSEMFFSWLVCLRYEKFLANILAYQSLKKN
jgi:hypothetical protein